MKNVLLGGPLPYESRWIMVGKFQGSKLCGYPYRMWRCPVEMLLHIFSPELLLQRFAGWFARNSAHMHTFGGDFELHARISACIPALCNPLLSTQPEEILRVVLKIPHQRIIYISAF